MNAPSYREYEVVTDGVIMNWQYQGYRRRTLIFPTTFTSIYAKENVQLDGPSHAGRYGYIGSTKDCEFVDPRSVVNAKYYTDCFLDNCLSPQDGFSAYCNRTNHQSIIYTKTEWVIPTIECLIRIYCDRQFIDSIDSRFHLSNWFDNNSIPFVWSSSQMDWYYMWVINSSGCVCGMGKADNEGGVIPIAEI